MKRLLIVALLFLAACSPGQGPAPTGAPIAPTATAVAVPTATDVAAPEPTAAADACPPCDVVPVFYDDDGSPDGTTALLYLLSHPSADLVAVSLTYGEVYPEVYIQHLGRMMDDFGIIHVPLGYGEIPASPDSLHFPESVREASSNFWGFPIPNADKTYQAHPAAELMVSVIRQSPRPVTLFVTGPCTNLAAALRIAPDVKDNIAAVHIMGGAVYAPGNVYDFFPDHDNQVAEWNFVADPPAANEVFESGLELYLVPLDATNQVFVSREDTGQWRQGGEVGDFAADIYDWLQDIFEQDAAIWDLMTAAIMLEPDLCEFTPLHLEVVTEPGNTLGQSAVVPDEAPNVSVCLEPDGDAIRRALIDVFAGSR